MPSAVSQRAAPAAVGAGVKLTAAFVPDARHGKEKLGFGRTSARFGASDYFATTGGIAENAGVGALKTGAADVTYHSALPPPSGNNDYVQAKHASWETADAVATKGFSGSVLGTAAMAGGPAQGLGHATIGSVGGGFGAGARLYRGPTYEAT